MVTGTETSVLWLPHPIIQQVLKPTNTALTVILTVPHLILLFAMILTRSPGSSLDLLLPTSDYIMLLRQTTHMLLCQAIRILELYQTMNRMLPHRTYLNPMHPRQRNTIIHLLETPRRGMVQ